MAVATRKPEKIGTVWTASASLMDRNGKVIARCIDTPNAIAKALMEMPRAKVVKSLEGTHPRAHWESRMKSWNVAKSGLIKLKQTWQESPRLQPSQLQSYADEITKEYGVPRIPIAVTDRHLKGQAVYNTWKRKGERQWHPKNIQVGDWDVVSTHPGEMIMRLGHELAHHIENTKRGSLAHSSRHGNLEDEVGLKLSRKWKETKATKPSRPPIESETKGGATMATEDLVRVINKAIRDDPKRAEHYSTGRVGFFVVGDQYYPWRDYAKIPDKSKAIAVHSHSGVDSAEYVERTGKREAFQPLNAADIYQWLKPASRGMQGKTQAIILSDGRLETLSISDKTDPRVFKLSRKQIENELHRPYDERAKYYEQHKGDSDWDTYKQERELLRQFAKKYGIDYHDKLQWEGLPAFHKSTEPPKMQVGHQSGSLGVPPQVHTQKSTGKAVTASMESFAKLQEARKEAAPVIKKAEQAKDVLGTLSYEDASELLAGLDLRVNDLDRRIDEGKANLESIKESLDPRIAKLTPLIPTTKEGRSEITHITKGQYRKVWGKEPPASIVSRGKVRWEYALDTIAQELHLEGKAQTEGKAPDEYLKGLIEDAKDTKELIRATEAEIRSDESTLKALDKLKDTIKARTAKTTAGPLLQKLARVPKVKATTKPKPETKAKAIVAGVAQELIRKTQAKRTPRAVLIDNSLLAKQVVPVSKAELWAKNPNRLDIRGVDTPGSGRVVSRTGFTDKGKARLSRKHHRGWKRIKL